MANFLKISLTFCITNLVFSVTVGDISGCDFEDTVDLRNSVSYENGSHLFEGVTIPPELIGEYDYEIIYEGERIEVPKHKRGCVCTLKSCVRLCCHPKAIFNYGSRECSKELQDDLEFDSYVNVTYSNGSSIRTHILQEFVPQNGLPCETMFSLNKFEFESDGWELFENGTLLRVNDGVYISKLDYCLHPVKVKSSHYVFMPHNCITKSKPSVLELIQIYLMAISIIFFLITIVVYLIVPKLQNLHGNCLICYLASLTVGYLMLVLISFNEYILPPACEIIGYLGYFSFVSAILWSSVISFDLWNTFRGAHFSRLRPVTLFKVYSLYAWGSASLLTALVYFIDISNVSEEWKPRVGVYTCWIYSNEWTALLYFYGPMLILILFNLIMFVSSARRIMQIKKSLEHNEIRAEQVERLRSNKQTFFFIFSSASLYFRLFFIMGIVWLLEICSYLLADYQSLFTIFISTFGNILNASHGVIMFVLLVLRSKVRKMVISICRQKRSSGEADDSDEGVSLQEKTCAITTVR